MIHEHAIVDPKATVAENVTIGPWSVIGPGVEIGASTWVGPHVVINGPTKIGENNQIFQFSSVGELPQDKKYKGEATLLEIGDNNIIREFTTLNRGTVQGGGVTKIGSDNLLMAYVHVAHDCIIGNHTVFANGASLAGHVIVEDHASLGGFSGVRQFTRIGQHAFVSANCRIVKDVLPFIIVSDYDAKPYGLNSVGLKRHGFDDKTMQLLKQAYRVIFRQNLTVEEAVQALTPNAQNSQPIQALIDFMQSSDYGLTR